MPSQATTVAEYLEELPADRRATIEAVRKVIRKNLPRGIEEGIQYGMIGYFVPHKVYPSGYHCDPAQPLPFAHLASQKNHMAVYMMSVYSYPGMEDWFRKAWSETGKKLNMGKSCIRFKKLDDVALDVVGQAIKRVSVKDYVANYEAVVKTSARKSPTKKASKKNVTKKKAPKKNATARKKATATKSAASKRRT